MAFGGDSTLRVLESYSRLTILATVVFSYILGRVVYRLYLSPIAKFPGPTLTAITSWIQFYHDVVRGGQFPFVVQKWHKKYGPIIRINPTEIHVCDPDFYDVIYSHSRVRKMESIRHAFGTPGSMMNTPDQDLHHIRRAALASYFSRRQVLEFTPYIQSRIDKLCERLNNEYKSMFKVVNLKDAFTAYTSDNIIYYAFGRSYDFLGYPNFSTPFGTAVESQTEGNQIFMHFPSLLWVMQSLPKSITAAIQPSIVPLLDFRDEIKDLILNIQSDASKTRQEADENIRHRTVFEEILHSNLPPEELSLSRLHDEGVIVVLAGIITTTSTMSIACFHVLSNPSIYQRLCQELTNAFPDPTTRPSLPELENLPYLNAVVQESLRFSYGISQRLPRISSSAIEFGSYTIPPGVPVSLTCYIQHHNERIFPCSQTFTPDRWLDRSQGPNTEEPLSKYLVSFAKGSRNCLGMNLANAELFIGLATLFRRVDMELFNTQRDAVDMAADHFVPAPKAGTQGVRVLIK